MGWFDADGYLYLGDRMQDMILFGGANVYPAEIEAALQEHPACGPSAVIGLPDEDQGNVVHAIVEADGAVDVRPTCSPSRRAPGPYKLPRTVGDRRHAAARRRRQGAPRPAACRATLRSLRQWPARLVLTAGVGRRFPAGPFADPLDRRPGTDLRSRKPSE